MTNKSSSAEQQLAGRIVFDKLKEELNINDLISNPNLILNSNPFVFIIPDFYSESAGVIGEIHAHIGRMKPSQSHKIATDVLKMLLFEKDRKTKLRKIVAVCSEEEKNQLEGQSYLAEAIRQFSIEVMLVDIGEELYSSLEKAQERQKMINA